jgi:bacillithiol biosynthesis cysteine-adding enzyme BshC
VEEGQVLIASGLFEAYTAGQAQAFFPGHFGRTEDWERTRRVARPLSPSLAGVLEAQNARYATSPARDAHLAALRAGSCAVVTGQQAGLFLGPLYTIYKAASAIRLARRFSEQWKTPVVPVFWLQTEDHDIEEIATCHVAHGSDEPLTLTVDAVTDGVSVAHRALPEAILRELAKLAEAVGRFPHGEEHLACLRRHYRPGAGWGEAFAGVLAELFSVEGLVFLDPRDPALAALGAPVHRKALLEAKPIARALTERVRALEEKGWGVPVHVREDSPLSFFHPHGPLGPRYRLAAAEGGYVEVGHTRTHTEAELLGVLEAHPNWFSTSALLRPILQDTWLPTVAYVGGPGEIAYFAQLAPLYAAYDITMPIVVPRNRFRLIEEPTRRALARRGLMSAEACRPIDDVLVRAGGAASDDGALLTKRVTDGIDRALEAVAPQLREAGEHAEHALKKTRDTMARAAEKLGHNYERALLLRDRELVEDVRRLQARLLPRGTPQERFFGISSFAARYGQRAVIERVLAAAEPLSTGIEDIDL